MPNVFMPNLLAYTPSLVVSPTQISHWADLALRLYTHEQWSFGGVGSLNPRIRANPVQKDGALSCRALLMPLDILLSDARRVI